MRAVAISSILRSLTSITLFSIIIYSGYELWIACLSVLISWILFFYIYDKPNAYQYIKINKIIGIHETYKIIKIGLPLGIITLLNQVHLNMPRYILNVYTTIDEVGIFAAISSLVVIGSVFVNSIGQALLPEMARNYSQGNLKKFLTLFLFLLILSIMVGGTAVILSHLAGGEILTIIYSKEYANYSELFSWIMLSGSAWYVSGAFGQALTAMRKFSSQSWLTGIVVIVTATICLLTVPSNGTIGAAQGLMAGALVKLILQSGQLIYFLFDTINNP